MESFQLNSSTSCELDALYAVWYKYSKMWPSILISNFELWWVVSKMNQNEEYKLKRCIYISMCFEMSDPRWVYDEILVILMWLADYFTFVPLLHIYSLFSTIICKEGVMGCVFFNSVCQTGIYLATYFIFREHRHFIDSNFCTIFSTDLIKTTKSHKSFHKDYIPKPG